MLMKVAEPKIYKIVLFIAFLSFFTLHCSITQGQSSYPFSVAFDDFNFLDTSSSILLTEGLVWDDEEFLVPIGFDFTIGNYIVDSIKVFVDGEITFYQSCGINNFPQGPVLFALFTDLQDRGDFVGIGDIPISPISFVTEGSPGNKIFKLEWKNASFWGGAGFNDYVNFQIWLYESGNTLMEIRFGTSNVTDPQDLDTWGYDVPGPIVNFNFEEDCDINTEPLSHIILNNPNNPDDTIVAGNIEAALSKVTIDNVPGTGTIYRWSKSQVIIEESTNMSTLDIYPNPSDGNFYITLPNLIKQHFGIEVYNSLGSIVYSDLLTIGNPVKEINLNKLTRGIYLIKLTSCSKSISQIILIN